MALEELVGLPDVDPTESFVILATGGTTTHPAALEAVRAANGSALWRMEFPADETGLDELVDSGVAFSQDGSTAFVVTAIAGGGTGLSRSYLNALRTDPSIPSSSTLLRSTQVALDARSTRTGVRLIGQVTVMDENRGPVSGATLLATWTRPDGTTEAQVAATKGGGIARFSLSGPGGLYQLRVTEIAKGDYDFDPQHSILEAAKYWF